MTEEADLSSNDSQARDSTAAGINPGLTEPPPKRPAAQDDFRTKFKTEMCKNFLDTGECAYSARCTFAHGLDELRKKTHVGNKYKTRPCKRFIQQGWCPYGARCLFIHNNSAEIDEDVGPLLSQDLMIILGGDADMTLPVRTPRHQQQTNVVTSSSSTTNRQIINTESNLAIIQETAVETANPAALLSSLLAGPPISSPQQQQMTANPHIALSAALNNISTDDLGTSSILEDTSTPFNPYALPPYLPIPRHTAHIVSSQPSPLPSEFPLTTPPPLVAAYAQHNHNGGNLSIDLNAHFPLRTSLGETALSAEQPPSMQPRATAPAFLCPPSLFNASAYDYLSHHDPPSPADGGVGSPFLDPSDALLFSQLMPSSNNLVNNGILADDENIFDPLPPSSHSTSQHHSLVNNNNRVLHPPAPPPSPGVSTMIQPSPPASTPLMPSTYLNISETPLHLPLPYPSPPLHNLPFSFSPAMSSSPQPSPPLHPSRTRSSLSTSTPQVVARPSLFAIRAGLSSDYPQNVPSSPPKASVSHHASNSLQHCNLNYSSGNIPPIRRLSGSQQPLVSLSNFQSANQFSSRTAPLASPALQTSPVSLPTRAVSPPNAANNASSFLSGVEHITLTLPPPDIEAIEAALDFQSPPRILAHPSFTTSTAATASPSARANVRATLLTGNGAGVHAHSMKINSSSPMATIMNSGGFIASNSSPTSQTTVSRSLLEHMQLSSSVPEGHIPTVETVEGM